MSEISGIRQDIWPDIRYPVFKMAGYPAKLLSSPSLILSLGYKVGDKLVVGSLRGSSATQRCDLVVGKRGRIVDLKGSQPESQGINSKFATYMC